MKKTIALLSAIASTAIITSCTPPAYGEMTPTTETPKLKGNYPTAYPSGQKNKVISPFKPHNVLDVKGMKPGNLAQDPTTAAIDPKTNKPISGTAKTFRIPLPTPPAPKPAETKPATTKPATSA